MSRKVEIIEMPAVTLGDYPPTTEFYVMRGEAVVRVCPSRAMAEEVAAGC